MTLWIDAQLSPALAPWIEENLGYTARSARYLGLHTAEDEAIFAAAREADAIVMTKDRDFVALLERHGSPPKVLWITVGNTSNANMKRVLDQHLHKAMSMLDAGESLVEIGEAP